MCAFPMPRQRRRSSRASRAWPISSAGTPERRPDVIRSCPKCSYTRKASDTGVPDWQCPSCGVAYAKFLEQSQAPAPSRAPVLSAQVAPGKVVMFATSWCPYCAKAREVFAAKGVRYTEIDIEADARGADFQRDVMGLGGVPTIVIGNRVTQGFDEGEIVKGLKEL